MAWTYTADPQHVTRDAVRFWAGDTISTATVTLQDGEVDYTISMEPNDARLAAALCCDALSAHYTRYTNITVGEVSKANGALAKNFHDRAEWLRNQVGKGALPFFGGQSLAGKEELQNNDDAVQPQFGSGQFDNPLARQFDGQPPDPTFPTR